MIRKLIKLTPEQIAELQEFFDAVKESNEKSKPGAISAQIYKDGMHVVFLSHFESIKVIHAISGRRDIKTASSAKQSYEDGVKRDA